VKVRRKVGTQVRTINPRIGGTTQKTNMIRGPKGGQHNTEISVELCWRGIVAADIFLQDTIALVFQLVVNANFRGVIALDRQSL